MARPLMPFRSREKEMGKERWSVDMRERRQERRRCLLTAIARVVGLVEGAPSTSATAAAATTMIVAVL